jgi:hypothetical protein
MYGYRSGYRFLGYQVGTHAEDRVIGVFFADTNAKGIYSRTVTPVK